MNYRIMPLPHRLESKSIYLLPHRSILLYHSMTKRVVGIDSTNFVDFPSCLEKVEAYSSQPLLVKVDVY